MKTDTYRVQHCSTFNGTRVWRHTVDGSLSLAEAERVFGRVVRDRVEGEFRIFNEHTGKTVAYERLG